MDVEIKMKSEPCYKFAEIFCSVTGARLQTGISILENQHMKSRVVWLASLV